jgi:hypothetical protein
MDFNQLSTDLEQYGTVEFCGHNGDDIDSALIVLSGFNNTITNVSSYNQFIENQISIEFPIVSDFSVIDGVLKAHYVK